MLTKKIIFAIILLTLFSINSCGPKIEMRNIYGTWTQINDGSLGDPNSKREISFTKEGKYKVKDYKNNSIVDSIVGTFELNSGENLIEISHVYPKLKDMKVIKLTETEMSVEIADDLSAHYTSNYRRQ